MFPRYKISPWKDFQEHNFCGLDKECNASTFLYFVCYSFVNIDDDQGVGGLVDIF